MLGGSANTGANALLAITVYIVIPVGMLVIILLVDMQQPED